MLLRLVALVSVLIAVPVAKADDDGPRMAIVVDGPRAMAIARQLERGADHAANVVATRSRYVGNSTEAWMIAERHGVDLVLAGVVEVDGRRTRMRVRVFAKDGEPLVSRSIAIPRSRAAARRLVERQARALCSRAIVRARRRAQSATVAAAPRRVVSRRAAPTAAVPTSTPRRRTVTTAIDPRG